LTTPSEAAQDRGDLPRGQVAVLLRQRIDGRRDDVLGNAEPAAEARQREDGGVVLIDVRAQERPRPALGARGVEVAAPHPVARRTPVLDERGRLHVVDEHEVGVQRELLGVDAVHLHVVRQRLVGEHALGAVQGGPQRGGGGVEPGVAAGDLPGGVDSEVGHHRDQRVEDLGGTTPEPAAAEVQQSAPANPLGQPQQHVHGARRRHPPVVVDGDHVPDSSSSASTRASTRARTRSRLVM
jgi:hypothetical protein